MGSNGVMAPRRKCLFALNQATLHLLAARAIEQSSLPAGLGITSNTQESRSISAPCVATASDREPRTLCRRASWEPVVLGDQVAFGDVAAFA